ncbi:MAG: hypothetical protein GC168_20340 [Candidatus Hydrogenedens sp.]|nr:hypothetical protein [Candidatus Hydrogenedens sp.]
MADEEEYVVLGDFWEPSQPLLLKSVLEANGIEARITGEYAGNISGNIGLFGGSSRGGIQLWVHADDAREAREILEQGVDSE